MGSEERAKEFAGPFDGIYKDLVFHMFNKCGNCPNRFHCLDDILKLPHEELLKDVITCAGKDCPIDDSVGRLVYKLSRNCAKCDKLPVCVRILTDKGYIAGIDYEQVQRCMICHNLENCVSNVVRKAGLSRTVLLARTTKMLMRCKWNGASRAMYLKEKRKR